MTQEFHLSVTPVGGNEYLVRTERVSPGVPLAEEQVTWSVEDWLAQAKTLMNDPVTELLRGETLVLPRSLESSLGSLPTDRPSGNLVSLGQQLYNALFQGLIRDSWMTARGIAQHRREVLRIRLGLKDALLPRLPWEVMHMGDRPLATGTDVIFSRYHSSFITLASGMPSLPPGNPDEPLKILMVLAAPDDQEALALKQEALHLQEELQSIRAGRGGLPPIELTILEQAGREQLTQALEHNHYQVFHYAGHSTPGAAGGSLCLVSSKTGLTEILSGDDLAGLLVNNGIRMAVFNSCRGGYTAAADTSRQDGNLAEALVKRGIPAVLAMSERIPDDVALNLSRLLYRNLRQSYPIDLSLSRARQGLIASYSSSQLYWALPILYLHPQFDGYLQTLMGDRPALGLDDPILAQTETGLPRITTEPLPTIDSEDFSEDLLEEFSPEELELEPLETETDWETVARMVSQLSQHQSSSDTEQTPLPAPMGESLMPETTVPPISVTQEDLEVPQPIAPKQPDLPKQPTAPTLTAPDAIARTAETKAFEPPANADTWDLDVYRELERMLANSGKPTDSIAAFIRAIQNNPSDAEAYHSLGLVLFEEGYLTEAVTAFHQALRINPLLAAVHNHLGVTLFQQGNLNQAIQSYNRAIQLDPNLAEAYHNLGIALRKQDVLAKPVPSERLAEGARVATATPVAYGDRSPLPAAVTVAPPPPSVYSDTRSFPLGDPHRPASPPRRRSGSPLLWTGAGGLGVAALLVGIWFAQNQSGALRVPNVPTLSQPSQTSELKNLNTAEVTAIAINRLNQGDIAKGTEAIGVLLDRNALVEAQAALTPVLNRQGENPDVLFLLGRLQWQSIVSGNRDYSTDDVRRAWESTVNRKAIPSYQNALGFAYYAEGNHDRAGRTWYRTLEALGQSSASVTNAPNAPTQEALTAYAGMAMVLAKTAENQPPKKRAEMVNQAIKLRDYVLSKDPTGFQPDSLAKNWLWSSTVLKDWQALLTLKPGA